jgi:hypothetical protein
MGNIFPLEWIMEEVIEKQAGRPRLHDSGKGRVKAWWRKQTGRRLDGYIESPESWRLQRLAETWGCFIAGAVERLVMEADDR